MFSPMSQVAISILKTMDDDRQNLRGREEEKGTKPIIFLFFFTCTWFLISHTANSMMSDNYVSPDTIYGRSFRTRIHPVSDYHTINRQQCFFPNRKAVCSLQYTTALSNARHAQRLTTTTTTWHMCVADTRQQIRNTSIPELSATTVLYKSDQLKKNDWKWYATSVPTGCDKKVRHPRILFRWLFSEQLLGILADGYTFSATSNSGIRMCLCVTYGLPNYTNTHARTHVHFIYAPPDTSLCMVQWQRKAVQIRVHNN